MKISPIVSYSNRFKSSNNQKQKSSFDNNISFNRNLEKDKRTKLQRKGLMESEYYWPKRKFYSCDEEFIVSRANFQRGSVEHLREMGEILRPTSDEVIINYVAIRPTCFGPMKSQRTYNKIKPYIDDARKRFANLKRELIIAEEEYNNNPTEENEQRYNTIAHKIRKMADKTDDMRDLMSLVPFYEDKYAKAMSQRIDDRFLY